MSTVVVFGATSYLGQYVIDDLLVRGWRVVAVTRNPAVSDILLRPWRDRITTASPDRVDVGEVAAVVNLAYVKVEKPHRLLRQNERLLRSIHDAAVRLQARHLVHASTMAVFGYELAETPAAVAAVRRAGDPYIESKVQAEQVLEALQTTTSYDLDIVRLGNIVGEGSPVWTANLAQRLRDGRAVGVVGREGYSNAAYAPNIAAYFGHLVDTVAGTRRQFGRYHHVADLSVLRWSAFVSRFADAIGVTPVFARRIAAPVRTSLRPAVARTVKSLYAGRLGTLTRRSLAAVRADAAVEAAMFATKTALAAGREADPFEVAQDRDLLTILASGHEFRSHTLPGWVAPIGADTALDRMTQWIVDAGFALH